MRWIKNLGQALCFAYSYLMCSSSRTLRTRLLHGRLETEQFLLDTLLATWADCAMLIVSC